MYLVLASRPNTAPTGETTIGYDRGSRFSIAWERVTDWPILGTAMTYAEARARFGGRPVLASMPSAHKAPVARVLPRPVRELEAA